MTYVERNAEFVREVQRAIGVTPDGKAGPRTEDAWHRFLEAVGRPHRGWPKPDERSLREFYGEPGPENLIMIPLPYPMRLAWKPETVVQRIRCHRSVADSLTRCLEKIGAHYGTIEELQAARMDLLGGVYSYRRMRGSASWSLHAWGAAIDLDPEQNGLHTPWPDQATMPEAVIRIFEGEGWLSGARAWGRDAMHFQATA